ncbi:unnamed protein product [Ilex paraguariensis]|uniref:Uncharacterized protein n=1 Tax=Ilex paraguariensis TaxID=185542 RepID=A0ABC8STB0_9AQUA
MLGPKEEEAFFAARVSWDEPEVLQNVKRVSPWQVEYVVATPPLYSALPPAKKLRVPQDTALLSDGDGELFFPITGLSNSMLGHLNPSLRNYSFPAGMQGARQDQICVFGLSNYISENTHQLCTDNLVYNVTPKLKTVSTELNICSSQSDNLSPDSQSSIHFSSGEAIGKRGCNSSRKVGISSFQLFGKVIHTNEPIESGFDDVAYTEDGGSKVYKEVSKSLSC